jgi:hypothetical protein
MVQRRGLGCCFALAVTLYTIATNIMPVDGDLPCVHTNHAVANSAWQPLAEGGGTAVMPTLADSMMLNITSAWVSNLTITSVPSNRYDQIGCDVP